MMWAVLGPRHARPFAVGDPTERCQRDPPGSSTRHRRWYVNAERIVIDHVTLQGNDGRRVNASSLAMEVYGVTPPSRRYVDQKKATNGNGRHSCRGIRGVTSVRDVNALALTGDLLPVSTSVGRHHRPANESAGPPGDLAGIPLHFGDEIMAARKKAAKKGGRKTAKKSGRKAAKKKSRR